MADLPSTPQPAAHELIDSSFAQVLHADGPDASRATQLRSMHGLSGDGTWKSRRS